MEREPRYGRYWRDEEERRYARRQEPPVYRGPLRHAGDWREVEHYGWDERGRGFGRGRPRYARDEREGRFGYGRERDYGYGRDERYDERGFGYGRGERDVGRRGGRGPDVGYGPMRGEDWDERGYRSGRFRDEGWDEDEREEHGLADRLAHGIRSFFRGERGPYRGKGPKGYRRSDERIREDVCDYIAETGWVDASDVEVRVHDGEVTLIGTVATRRDKRALEEIVDHVPGVEDVHNQLRVRRRDAERSAMRSPGAS